MDRRDIKNRFAVHPRSEKRTISTDQVHGRSFDLAIWFDRNLPEGREKSLAITKVEEAMFWADASLSRVTDDGARQENGFVRSEEA